MSPSTLALHHIGYVVPSIEASLADWQRSLHTSVASSIFEDPIQQVRVLFMDMPGRDGVKLELVAPLTPTSPVARINQAGGGLHHLCFIVDDLEQHIAAMKAERALLVRAPVPAVAFEGRRIAWMRTREKLLVEYLEATPR